MIVTVTANFLVTEELEKGEWKFIKADSCHFYFKIDKVEDLPAMIDKIKESCNHVNG